MKFKISQRGLFYKFTCSLVVFLLLGLALEIFSDPLKGLTGAPFTDPTRIMDMPEKWKRQSIKYDTSVSNVDLVVSLDQQMYPALKKKILKYASENNLKIVVKNGTCGISSGMLSRKAIDIGGFCCAPGLIDRLPGLKFHTIGIAAIALIVHPENNIDNVTIGQARKIFTGEIYHWSELKTSKGVSGLNLPILPVGRLHCKLRPGHWRLLLDNEDLFSPSIEEVGAIPDMISQVSTDKHAIGYETLWMNHFLRHKGKVKVLRINGYHPNTPYNLLSGKYPLYRVYNLTTWEGEGIANPSAQKLVKYLTQQAEYLDKKYSIIPASRLSQAGWKFMGDELIGEPD